MKRTAFYILANEAVCQQNTAPTTTSTNHYRNNNSSFHKISFTIYSFCIKRFSPKTTKQRTTDEAHQKQPEYNFNLFVCLSSLVLEMIKKATKPKQKPSKLKASTHFITSKGKSNSRASHTPHTDTTYKIIIMQAFPHSLAASDQAT